MKAGKIASLGLVVIVSTVGTALSHGASVVEWPAAMAPMLRLCVTFAVLGLIFGLGIFPLEARALVPLAGMTIGNSMTATVLVATRIVAEFKQQRPLIEVSLALGYTASDSFRPYLRDALRTALVPQIETTKAVGIVFIPGAMTGLILAGVPVFDAVKVQVVVMYLVLASVAVSTTTVAVGLSRTLFTSDQRALHLEGERG